MRFQISVGHGHWLVLRAADLTEFTLNYSSYRWDAAVDCRDCVAQGAFGELVPLDALAIGLFQSGSLYGDGAITP